jgi:GT2 family glycosyltransferase
VVGVSSVLACGMGYPANDGDRVTRDSQDVRSIVTQPTTTGVGTIYVLAPVHDRRAMTERFIRCLMAQSDQGFHLVIVDDGSRDGTSEMVRSVMPTATIITGTGDWWWAGSLQRARQWLEGQPAEPDDLVLIANDDTTFQPDLLVRARAAMRAHPHSLLLAEAFSSRSGASKGVGMRVDWQTLSLRPTHDPDAIDCLATRGLFLRRDDFLRLGPFHTVLLPHYLSDYEFSIRAARRGLALRADPSVRLVMDEAATGIRVRDLRSPRAYLRSVLSMRSTENPVYWTTFVMLASPKRYVLQNVVRVWLRFGKGLVRSALGTPEPAT